MRTPDGRHDLLLNSEVFFVQLDPERRVDDEIAVAFLGRRNLSGGVTLVGSVEMQRDGRWRASVAADPARVRKGYVRVAVNCENRYDAIVAVWHAREEAYVAWVSL
jgi:hypothetical protein